MVAQAEERRAPSGPSPNQEELLALVDGRFEALREELWQRLEASLGAHPSRDGVEAKVAKLEENQVRLERHLERSAHTCRKLTDELQAQSRRSDLADAKLQDALKLASWKREEMGKQSLASNEYTHRRLLAMEDRLANLMDLDVIAAGLVSQPPSLVPKLRQQASEASEPSLATATPSSNASNSCYMEDCTPWDCSISVPQVSNEALVLIAQEIQEMRGSLEQIENRQVEMSEQCQWAADELKDLSVSTQLLNDVVSDLEQLRKAVYTQQDERSSRTHLENTEASCLATAHLEFRDLHQRGVPELKSDQQTDAQVATPGRKYAKRTASTLGLLSAALVATAAPVVFPALAGQRGGPGQYRVEGCGAAALILALAYAAPLGASLLRGDSGLPPSLRPSPPSRSSEDRWEEVTSRHDC